MTLNRDTQSDKELLKKTIQSGNLNDPSNKGGSWLGHGQGSLDKGGARIDNLLICGATRSQLKVARPSYETHLNHLKRDHGLPIVEEGLGENDFCYFDREVLGLGSFNPKNTNFAHDHKLPEEVTVSKEHFIEGAVTTITVNAYERDPKARQRCIENYGATCWVCEFNFEAIYGQLGRGFIHVHHVKELHKAGGLPYEVDPINDLVPVCPNCHAMLHRGDGANSIDELRRLLKKDPKPFPS